MSSRRPSPSARLGILSPKRAAGSSWRRQSRGRLRAAPRSRHVDLDSHRERLLARRRAGLPQDRLRRRRRARRGRPAHPRDDRSARQGERFLAISGDSLSIRDISAGVARTPGPKARKAPTREVPNWLVRLIALFDPMARQIAPQLGKIKNASNAKARARLGWSPRSPRRRPRRHRREPESRFGLVNVA